MTMNSGNPDVIWKAGKMLLVSHMSQPSAQHFLLLTNKLLAGTRTTKNGLILSSSPRVILSSFLNQLLKVKKKLSTTASKRITLMLPNKLPVRFQRHANFSGPSSLTSTMNSGNPNATKMPGKRQFMTLKTPLKLKPFLRILHPTPHTLLLVVLPSLD